MNIWKGVRMKLKKPKGEHILLLMFLVFTVLAIVFIVYSKELKKTTKYRSRFIPTNAKLVRFGNGWYEFCQHNKLFLYNHDSGVLTVTGECE